MLEEIIKEIEENEELTELFDDEEIRMLLSEDREPLNEEDRDVA